jgi:dipeptidyl aminopeptidase/acylaminoacyl peptidase
MDSSMVASRLQRLVLHLEANAAPQPAAGQTVGPHAFDIADAQALKSVGGMAVSPCAGWIAYTVSEKDLKEDKSSSSLWLVSTKGGDPIRMSAPGLGASSPEFSPDGKMLCFTASRPIPPVVSGLDEALSTTQVWAHHLGPGGDAQPLTFVKQGISSFSWSPDLNRPRLLLTITDPAPDADAEEKERKKPKPWVMDRQQFKRDYAGYLHNRLGKTHLYVQEGGQLTQITSGQWNEGSGAWSPCGTKVAFASNRTDNPDANSCSNIWVVSANNTDQGKSLVQVTADGGAGESAADGHQNGSPKWSPDGRSIVYSTYPTHPEVMWYATSHLAIAAADGSDAATGGRILTRKLDRNLHGAEYSAQGHCIFATVEDRGCSHLCSISLTGAEEEEVTTVVGGEVSVSSWEIVGDTIVTSIATATHPNEIFVVDGHPSQKDRCAHLFSSHSFSDTNTDASRERPTSKLDC